MGFRQYLSVKGVALLPMLIIMPQSLSRTGNYRTALLREKQKKAVSFRKEAQMGKGLPEPKSKPFGIVYLRRTEEDSNAD